MENPPGPGQKVHNPEALIAEDDELVTPKVEDEAFPSKRHFPQVFADAKPLELIDFLRK